MDGIRKLNEQISFLELRVYNDIDTSLSISKMKGNNNVQINLKFEEVMEVLANYLSILDPNILEYRS